MSISTVEFDYLRGLVQQQSAIVLDADKTYLAVSRLQDLARREGFETVGGLLSHLRGRPCNGLHHKVVEAMTTNETYFFRDVHPFDCLRQVVLPDLLARRAAERRLAVWSAACSTGQEPYSVAMLLREPGGVPAAWQTTLLATDLCTEALARAERGQYSQLEVNRGLPARMLVKYFDDLGGAWQVKPEIRRAVEFRPLNLIAPWPALPRMDVVFLRNVLIYFDVPTKRQVLAKVRAALRPDGYLFLGGAETVLNLDDAFERVPYRQANCYRLRPA